VTEQERWVGHYKVQERTARQLIMVTRWRTPIAIGLMWAAFLPVAVLTAPWVGGTRLFVASAGAGILAVVSLLIAYLTPVERRIVVDLEKGEFRIVRRYLPPRRDQAVVIPVRTIESVRRRRQTWGAPGEMEKTEWLVELLTREDQRVLVTDDLTEEPAAELARLVSEVAGCPLGGPS
jgi:hypothetical protein